MLLFAGTGVYESVKYSKSAFFICVILLVFSTNVSANNVHDEYRNTYDEKKKVAYIGGAMLRRYISGRDFQSKIIKVDFKNNVTSKINGPWANSKGLVTKVSLSSNGMYLSSLFSSEKIEVSLYVVMLNEEDSILKIDENVTVYDWSPNGKNIVYIKPGDGIYIYSMETREKIKISESAREVSWSKHDNAVYMVKGGYENSTYFRINVKELIVDKSNIEGIEFSQNGKHFARAIVEKESMVYPKVFRSSNNFPIAEFINEAAASNGLSGFYWINNNIIVFQALTSFFVYDISKLNIIRNNIDERTSNSYKANSFAPVTYGYINMVAYRNGYWELQNIISGKVLFKVKNISFKNKK